MEKITLKKSTVQVRHGKNRSNAQTTRDGYVMAGGQVFLPPSNPKKVSAWEGSLQLRLGDASPSVLLGATRFYLDNGRWPERHLLQEERK